MITGYVHKPYPPKYASLGRYAGFESALLVRGTEGGVIPSLRQPGKVFRYEDFGVEQPQDINPLELGIAQVARAVPLPEAVTDNPTADEIARISDTSSAAAAAAETGIAALQGAHGPAYDSLLYACSLILWHTGKATDLKSAADIIRQTLDSGSAMSRLR